MILRDIKLRELEVVNAETFELACKVCDLADTLYLKWADGASYFDRVNFNPYCENTCFNLHGGFFGDKEDYLEEGYTVISAEEWLNRHGVYIPGQIVLAKDKAQNSWREKIYIAPYSFVRNGHREAYRTGKYFKTIKYDEWKPTYPEWPDRVSISIDGGKPFFIKGEDVEALKQCEVK